VIWGCQDPVEQANMKMQNASQQLTLSSSEITYIKFLYWIISSAIRLYFNELMSAECDLWDTKSELAKKYFPEPESNDLYANRNI